MYCAVYYAHRPLVYSNKEARTAVDRRTTASSRELPLRVRAPQRRIRSQVTDAQVGDVVRYDALAAPGPGASTLDGAAEGVRRRRQRTDEAVDTLVALLRDD